jgi:YD repeat-containing protein
MEDGTLYNIKRYAYPTQEVRGEGDDIAYRFECRGKPYLDSVDLPSGDRVVFDVNLSDPEDPLIQKVKYYQKGADLTDPNKTIVIERDDHDHITAIYPPSELDSDGNVADGGLPAVQYEYDGYHNLVKVHKLVDRDADPADQNETTTYVYDDHFFDPWDHFVTDIRDPRGLSPIRYVYDEGGRLVAIYDAKGNYIKIEHDISNRTETVTDRLGNITIYGYDERGRVTSETKFVGGESIETQYEYNDPYYPDNPSKVTDPCGNETEYVYDSDGRTTRVTGPLNNVTDNEYDYNGNLTRTSQWAPKDPEAQNPTFSDDYNEVSRNTNTYYRWDSGTGTLSLTTGSLLNLLGVTETIVVFDDPQTEPNEFASERIEYIYDDSNGLLLHTKRIDPEGPNVVTSYLYNEAESNSPDQPYSVSEPYYEGDSPNYVRYVYYDENGNQKKSWYTWTDPNDAQHEIEVASVSELDDAGRVVAVNRVTTEYFNGDPCDPCAVVLSETVYNSLGKVDMVTNEHGTVTVYDYDETGNLVETVVYDVCNTPLSVTQRLHDAEGRVIVTVAYDPCDVQAEPVGTENVYDEIGRVVKTRRWADVEVDLVEFWVDDDGDILEGDDIPAGETYVGLKVPEGVIVANAWDGTGEKPSSVGWTSEGDVPEDGNELSYTRTVYNTAGRVKMSIVLDEYGYEQPTSYKCDAAGKQTVVIDPCGHSISWIQDGPWHVIGSNSLTGTHKTETRFKGGRRAWVVDARGFESGAEPNDFKTQFVYDDAGQLITTIHPPTEFEGSTGVENTYSHMGYDALGQKAWQSSQVDEEDQALVDSNEIREFEYDAAGRPIVVELPAVNDPNDNPDQGENVRPRYDYFYDDLGNLAGIWDPNLRLTVFKYDHLNKQTHGYMSFEHTGSLTSADDIYNIDLSGKDFGLREYDKYGRLIKVTDFNDHLTILEYNNRGLLEYERHYESESDYDSANPTYNAKPEVYYEYGSLGRRTAVTVTEYNSSGGIVSSDDYSYSYDEQGRVAGVNTPQTGYVEVGYDYNDITGRLELVRTPDTDTWADVDTQVLYGYDVLGRLEQVIVEKRNGTDLTPSSQEISVYTYNAVGSVNSVEYANGNLSEYTYDAMNRLIYLDNWKDNSRVVANRLSSFEYTVAADGMRVEVNEVLGGQSTIITWDYDHLNRVIYEDYNEPGDTNDYTDQYAYDLVGNRYSRDMDGTIMYYFYNDMDQLTKESANSDGSDPCVTYTYNDNSSMTKMPTKRASDSIVPT